MLYTGTLAEVPTASAAVSRETEDLQKIYDVVPRTEDVFNLNKRDLEFKGKLGKYFQNYF